MAKTHTSTEVKQRWIDKTYKRVMVNLRMDKDKYLLDFLEDYKGEIGTSQIFREALADYIKDVFPDWLEDWNERNKGTRI